ncbi:MAG: carboxypeptidase M32 [Candidatus Aenigmatarchaeota archaeon]
MQQNKTYQKLITKIKKISNLGYANSILSWDQQVMMPEGGIEARSSQRSFLSGLTHELLIEDELGELLEKLNKKNLDEEEKAVVREIDRDYKRARKIPTELTEKISKQTSTTVDFWKKARQNNNFSSFAPHLKKVIELKRKYANYIDPDRESYKVLFEDYEPYINMETVEGILKKLKRKLPKLINKIANSSASVEENSFKGNFPSKKQEEIVKKLVNKLGFDFQHGRIDTSTHPFTTGNQYDTRITTRYNEKNIGESITSTIHEFGHGLYNLNLPKKHYGTPLGFSRELSVHESQSRFWENHIGRSKSFWKFFLPTLKGRFPEQFKNISPQDCFESINQVYDNNPIRVDADELTYHLHILLRFEIGRDLINGKMKVKELPHVWNNKMEEYLGFRPENDAKGCLQDIHWAWGNFGYFSTYSMGSMIAAQIHDAISSDISLDEKIENGNFKPIRKWLKEKIHKHGQKYKTEELIKRATGEKPTADHFLSYAKEKYGKIYEI